MNVRQTLLDLKENLGLNGTFDKSLDSPVERASLLDSAEVNYLKEIIPSPQFMYICNLLDCDLESLSVVNKEYEYYKLPILQDSIYSDSLGLECISKFNFGDRDGKLRPVWNSPHESSDHSKTYTTSGYFHLRNSRLQNMLIRVNLTNWPPDRPNFIVTLFIRSNLQKVGLNILKQIDDYIAEHNPLKFKVSDSYGTIIDGMDHYKWSQLALPKLIINKLKEEIEYTFSQDATLLRYGIPTQRGIILYGKPGVGKTLIGKILASTVKSSFIWVTASQITEANDVTRLFRLARELSPCIIFLEDLDLYASQRNWGPTSVLGELFGQIDGFHRNEKIIVVATTNDLESIDPALKERPSRFDLLLEIQPPDSKDRMKIIKRKLKGFTVEHKSVWDLFVDKTAGMTGAEIQELCIMCKRTAIRRNGHPNHSPVILEQDVKEKTSQVGIGNKKEVGFGNKN